MQELNAFSKDRFVLQAVKDAVKKYGIQTIVETGTYKGDTTPALCLMVPHVVSVEVNPQFHEEARVRLREFPNVNLIRDSSPVAISRLAPSLPAPILFFLDAHWYSYCPLLDEIKAIAESKTRPFLVIHDFHVPGTDLGFDSYNGQRYDFEWVKPALDLIGPYRYWYNAPDKAEGARRGVLYVDYLTEEK